MLRSVKKKKKSYEQKSELDILFKLIFTGTFPQTTEKNIFLPLEGTRERKMFSISALRKSSDNSACFFLYFSMQLILDEAYRLQRLEGSLSTPFCRTCTERIASDSHEHRHWNEAVVREKHALIENMPPR